MAWTYRQLRTLFAAASANASCNHSKPKRDSADLTSSARIGGITVPNALCQISGTEEWMGSRPYTGCETGGSEADSSARRPSASLSAIHSVQTPSWIARARNNEPRSTARLSPSAKASSTSRCPHMLANASIIARVSRRSLLDRRRGYRRTLESPSAVYNVTMSSAGSDINGARSRSNA